MKIPSNHTEQSTLNAIEVVVNRLSFLFLFGFHQIEDIKQEARIIAIDGLERYDEKRPLENFLWTHVKNRLGNFKRNNWERLSKPCLECPFHAYDPELKESHSGCKLHSDLWNCEPYRKWFSKTAAKKNIISFASIDNIDYEREKNMKVGADPDSEADKAFVLNVVEENLSPELLLIYFDFLDR